jgi:hypothetical protein
MLLGWKVDRVFLIISASVIFWPHRRSLVTILCKAELYAATDLKSWKHKLIQSCCALGSTMVSCWLKRSFRDYHKTSGSFSVMYSHFKSG